MSKVSDWLIEMEEDATVMSREEWTSKHGESVIEVYNKINSERQGDPIVHTHSVSD